MSRSIPAVVVVVLLGATAQTTAEPHEPAQGADGAWFVVTDASGQTGAFIHDAGASERPVDGGGTTYTCSNTMHDVYVPSGSAYCNTGTHVRGNAPLMVGSATTQVMLTGMLEHVLSHADGEVRFQCSWVNGAWQGCRVASAEWPPVGAPFCYEMWAHAGPPAGTFVPNATPCDTTGQVGTLVFSANAPPGGSGMAAGAWSMSFTH